MSQPQPPQTPARSLTVYAPATVANLGPGYDIIGMAVTGLGDRVVAERHDDGEVLLEGITGDGGRLPTSREQNTATVAADASLEALGEQIGVRMTLHKGLPLGSGLGSSAASAVAGSLAAALLARGHDEAFDRRELLEACCEAEKVAAGVAHADNVAPSLLGGVVLIRRYNPLEVLELPVPDDLHIVLAIPSFSVSTREAREVLPEQVRLSDAVRNSGNVAAMVTGFFRGDLELIGRAMDDAIVEPVRAAIIPGYRQVKRAAVEAGALGASISGAGPTCVALAASESRAGRIAVAMERAWAEEGIVCRVHICLIDQQGARLWRPGGGPR